MMKRLAVLAAALLAAAGLYAREASFLGEDYEMRLFYNDTAAPGDAVFVRLRMSQSRRSKVERSRFEATTATLELYLGEKRLDRAEFYELPEDSGKSTRTMLAGIPLSSWWTHDGGYSLKVKYVLYGEQALEFELPFGIEEKEFESYTLETTEAMTTIHNDTSTTRVKQSERLNAVLGTVDPSAVYQTAPFTPPTTATRRTSYYAERRVYVYTNGKRATSLHYGTDYGIPTGSTVQACADGKVVIAENRIVTGWSVVVEHLPGLYSLYYHMSELKVKEGDMVKAGDLLGLSGATGFATGPHLHWEMRLNMSAVNPDFFTTDFTQSAAEGK